MKTLLRILLIATLFLSNYQLASADEGDSVKEITTEATYQMSDADTPAKADEQALLRAKRNALEQASSLSIPMEKISSLPTSALEVTVLDKSRSMSGDKMVSWVQIKSIIHTDKLEEALKKSSLPDEYYYEMATYQKGSAPTDWSRVWQGKKQNRMVFNTSGFIVTSILKEDNHTTYFFVGNKYFDLHDAAHDDSTIKTTEEDLGLDTLNGKAVRKNQSTYTYPDGLVYKTISYTDPETNFQIRSESSSNKFNFITVCEFRNFKPGPIDPSVFALPTGYTRVSSMDQLFMGTPSTNTTDPFMQAMDSAMTTATQKVIDNALGNILGF